MGLFSKADMAAINKVAEQTRDASEQVSAATKKSVNSELNAISQAVIEYFKDSQAILISSESAFHDYITDVCDSEYCGIDTETTGLDRVHDHVVGASLYVPGKHECYIPNRHIIPIFDQPYKNQIPYELMKEELDRVRRSKVKLIFANADFDLAMMFHSYGVDLCERNFYDVILAWRCIKEDEKNNALKILYNKYVLKGKGDPKRFSDFFTPQLFPYCKPEVAKLYAANDAKIAYELFQWQLPYLTPGNPKCQKKGLEAISGLVWDVEFPLMSVCQDMHRTGIYLDKSVSSFIQRRYAEEMKKEQEKLAKMVQELIDSEDFPNNTKRPFRTGKDFNPNSGPQVKYLVYELVHAKIAPGSSLDKNVLGEINAPVTTQILKVRSLKTLISTFVDKLPKATTPDSRIHASFKQIGADCVVGNTIIPTENGYFTAKELCEFAEAVPGEHVDVEGVRIVNKDQQLEAAQSAIYYHDFDTVRIVTDLGFVLEGTPNHPIMVSSVTSSDKDIIHGKLERLQHIWDNRRFKCLSDIQVGDIVEIPCNYTINPPYVQTGLKLGTPKWERHKSATIPEMYTEDFAEFLGMYHADGSSNFREGTYTVALSNDDEDVIRRFEELAEMLFHVPVSHYTKQKENHEVETYISSVMISDIDRILSHGKKHKRIPAAIWKSPTSVINAYIRGLTLDSSVYREPPSGRVRFELSIINEDDARFIQLHLASQGIICGWGHNENKDFLSPRLSFNADNYLRFLEVVGFIESRKAKSTPPCFKNKYERRRIGNSFRLSVKEITYSKADVYDLHVPGTHSFVSNGMISHNTGRMSSENPNMQNIPSHAVDIRHMFRATPSRYEDRPCTSQTSNTGEKQEVLKLSRYDSVKSVSGEYIKVKDLKVDDVLCASDDKMPIRLKVQKLELSETSPDATIYLVSD